MGKIRFVVDRFLWFSLLGHRSIGLPLTRYINTKHIDILLNNWDNKE
ncbi:hypothetical protein OOZ15_03580 [Galbibacter sp. EGI 63066]|nr:hypothetical protein [Galbibacter sp. EGI 63066]MCX2679012.1 hypothetical protein [Galbibacter sp. EGI 63066]